MLHVIGMKTSHVTFQHPKYHHLPYPNSIRQHTHQYTLHNSHSLSTSRHQTSHIRLQSHTILKPCSLHSTCCSSHQPSTRPSPAIYELLLVLYHHSLNEESRLPCLPSRWDHHPVLLPFLHPSISQYMRELSSLSQEMQDSLPPFPAAPVAPASE